MNATETLDTSHQMIIQALDDLPDLEWDIPNVCGQWSVKEIVAHLASYEHVLVDVLKTFLGAEPTPYIYRFVNNIQEFNDTEVKQRRYDTAQHVLDDYNDTQVETISLLEQIPADKVGEIGTMPWYGKGSCLNDLINVFYDHTCEHCAQITRFRQKTGTV